MSGDDKATPARGKGKTYVVTGFQAPIRVDNGDGTHKTYKKGDKLVASDWPNAKVTIPNAIKGGYIEEVK